MSISLNLGQVIFVSVFGIFAALPSWEELETNLTKNNLDLPPWIHTGQITEVKTQILLAHVESTTLTQLGTSFHLIQQWEDVRLQYDVNSIRFAGKYVLMDLDKYVTIWTPDSYISNALTAVQHSVTKPNVFIRVYPNGTLVKSTRLTISTSCPLTSKGFPRGSQTCAVTIESFSYSTLEMRMTWDQQNPFRFKDDFSTNGLSVSTLKEINCQDGKKEFPCLKFEISIVRDFSQFILRIYIPSIFLVILGWMSMWIDKGQVGARTSLGVLCVLSIVTQLVGVVSAGNGLEGLLAIDVWIAVCMLFTIMSLVVFAIVHNMKRRKDKTKEKYKADLEGEITQPCCEIQYGKLQNIFRVIYPLLFMTFNIAYWSYFLSVD
uniref:Glutamate-gated chloride channel alpha-like n=1 Tax=Crassostrea virginica TaxID=6565 RepID=A0A8B8BKP5_CRAVI|nr:glutamate-gated chloride channel alpha-like [Crassostrea virginica]